MRWKLSIPAANELSLHAARARLAHRYALLSRLIRSIEQRPARTMNDSRNHHFTPRWYLRRFAHPELKKNKDEILVYGFAEKKVKRMSARGIGAQNDFNRLEIDGAEPTWIETQWTENHETPAKIVIDGIDATGSLPGAEDMETLIRFLSLLFSRNPRIRKMNFEFKQMMFQGLAKKAVSSNEGWNSFVEWCVLEGIDLGKFRQEELTEASAKNATIATLSAPNATFQLEQRLASGTHVEFRAREWILVEAAPKEEFWTSDYPVLQIPQPDGTTDIFFPLCPTRALIGQQPIGHPPPQLNQANMGFINAMQAQSAEHFVVMRDPKRITLYHDDTGPQHWPHLIDGTRDKYKLGSRFSLQPRRAPIFPFWKDPRAR